MNHIGSPTIPPKALLGAALLGIAINASAVEPMPINKGGAIQFIPTIDLSQGYDDNIDEAPTGEEESSNVTKVVPTFLLAAQERQNRYQFRYTPELQLYSHESDDNRVNHNAALTSRMSFNTRNALNTGLRFARNQEAITATNRRFDETDGDINNRLTVDGTYQFGADKARGQIEVNAKFLANRYANNKVGGSNNQSREYNNPTLDLTYFWRVAPKTRVLLEGRYSSYDYQWNESQLDSNTMSSFVGVAWDATAKTQGSVRVGREEKSFDSSSKTDTDLTAWDAEISWEPMARSRIQLSTSNRFEEGSEESPGVAFEETIEQTTYSIRWQHDWDERVQTNVGMSVRDKDYLGGSNDGRNDQTETVSLGITYSVRRWLDLGFEAQFKNNDSDNPGSSFDASYDRNNYFFTITMSL